jgi:APA family basic amino acid/polyamine antiporter
VPFAPERAGAPPLPEALALALVSIFFSFGGFWEASRIAGDVRDPSRTMPRALVAGVACVTAVYLVTSLAFLYLVPAREATTASEFARRAGQALLGARGPSALASVVLLSVISSAMALLIMAPRLYVAMSLDGVFPSAVASLHPTAGTPVRATALLAVLASAFALVGTFQEIVAFFMCTTLGFIALAAAALVVVRRRTAGPDAFRSPGYPASTLSFVVLVLAVVTLVAVSRPVQAALGFALVLIGVPVHARLFPTRQS